MCGIVGFVGGPSGATILAEMLSTLAHRGPDGEGHYIDRAAELHLGQRRLAVIDIPGGEQPMWNEDRSVCVVFNGEIYNHRDLRSELEALGHAFRSDHSDTEVLVHGFEQWGENLPAKLNGMFAFAIYDQNRKVLFLSRDRFGEKPLFYTNTPGFFSFASELTTLLTHPRVSSDPDKRALQKFYAHAFFPAPHTPFRAIRKLPAGHSLVYDLRGGVSRIERYWRFMIEPAVHVPVDAERRWTHELRDLLSAAVKRRLESDVPLGILLSGGIDSSAVVACAAMHRPAESIDTFSIGFSEPSFDESAQARRVAEHLRSRHHTEMCVLSEAQAEIPRLLSRIDEPVGDSSILPTHHVCRFARRFVTVALSGDGGDELFAGYDPLSALGPSTWYRRLVPQPVHSLIKAGASLLPLQDRNMSFDFKVRRWLRGMRFPPALWNPVWLAALAPEEIGLLFGERVDVEDLYSEALETWHQAASPHLVDRTLEFYTNFYLQDGILVKTDRASMLESLELRAPFLDNDLVEFARRLPHDFKLRNGERKFLLKRALENHLPQETLRQPKKGFGIPLAKWLRELPQPQHFATPFVDPAFLEQSWALHRSRQADYRHLLWCTLTLEARFTR